MTQQKSRQDNEVRTWNAQQYFNDEVLFKEDVYTKKHPFNVKGYGAKGDGVTDDTASIQAAIDAAEAAGGGVVYFPTGTYLVTSPLNLANTGNASTYSITIQGAGLRTTVISAVHTGHAFDCTGSSFIKFSDFTVSGNGVKTAFLLARNSTNDSAGDHMFTRVHTTGSFSVAALYNYASELLRCRECNFINTYTGSPCIIITRRNVSSVTSSFATIATGNQSTQEFLFDGCETMHYGLAGDNDCIYLAGVASFRYVNGFAHTDAGRAIVNIDAVDDSSTNLQFSGLMLDGGSTTYGFYITGTNQIAYLIVEDINDGATKTYANGGRTLYAADSTSLAYVQWRNVLSGSAYVRTYEVLYSNMDMGANHFECTYSFSLNKIEVDSVRFTLGRWDLSGRNEIFFRDPGNHLMGSVALATTATDGFLYIPTCAGTPTGVPTAYAGMAPIVFDTTNNKLYVYDGGWVDVT